MDTPIIPVLETDRFSFKCTSCVPCFNDCCRDLNQYLTPYDILRIKTHLNLASGEFLAQFTRSHTGQESGLPVITLKTDPASGFQCPFVRPEGCLVYENRPTSCRLYPLARAFSRSRETGQRTEQYFLIKESHCLGFESGSGWTVQQWLEDQTVRPYNEMNDMMMDIIHLKNIFRPGPLDLKSAHLFHLACYDLDAFRVHVFEKGILGDETPATNLLERARWNESELLKLGLNWIKKILFGNAAL
ncbi:MAG: YkgJ family cysteine cluster protein [Pseudomonadota bacterium]